MSRDTIFVLHRQPDGGYALQRTIRSDTGLYLSFSSDIQFSADGSRFFAYEASSSRLFYYDVSTTPDTRALVLRGQLVGVQTAPVYDSPNATLVLVSHGERQFLRINSTTGLFEVVATAGTGSIVSGIDIAVAGSTRYAVFPRRPFHAGVGGQIDSRSVAGAVVSAVSPTGRYSYALSPNDDGLAVYDTQTQTWTAFVDIFNVATATLDGVAAIVVSEANGVQYAAVVSPLSGTLTTLATTPDGVTRVVDQVTRPDLVGVTSLAYSAADQALYTTTAGELRRYAMPLDLSNLGPSSAPVAGSQLTSVHVGNGRV